MSSSPVLALDGDPKDYVGDAGAFRALHGPQPRHGLPRLGTRRGRAGLGIVTGHDERADHRFDAA